MQSPESLSCSNHSAQSPCSHLHIVTNNISHEVTKIKPIKSPELPPFSHKSHHVFTRVTPMQSPQCSYQSHPHVVTPMQSPKSPPCSHLSHPCVVTRVTPMQSPVISVQSPISSHHVVTIVNPMQSPTSIPMQLSRLPRFSHQSNQVVTRVTPMYSPQPPMQSSELSPFSHHSVVPKQSPPCSHQSPHIATLMVIIQAAILFVLPHRTQRDQSCLYVFNPHHKPSHDQMNILVCSQNLYMNTHSKSTSAPLRLKCPSKQGICPCIVPMRVRICLIIALIRYLPRLPIQFICTVCTASFRT